MFRTVKKLFKKACKIDGKLKYYMIVYFLSTGTIPLILVEFVNVITKELSNLSVKNTTNIVLIILVFLITDILLRAISIFSESKADNIITYVRMTIQNELNEKLFMVKYRLLENSDYLTRNHKIFNSLSNSEVGVECTLKQTLYAGGLILSIINLIVVITLQWNFVALFFLGYIVIGVIVAHKNSKYKTNYENEYSYNNKQIDYVFNTVNDINYTKDIMIYKVDGILKNKFQKCINNISSLLGKSVKYNFKTNILYKTIYFILGMVGFFIFVIKEYYSGIIDISALSVSIYSAISFTEISKELFEKVEKISYESVSVNGLLNYLSSDINVSENNELHPIEQEYELEIINLYYKYSPESKYILKNINLKIRTGEKIAVVGLNGAGKSTLIKCISGLYKDYEGIIKYKGIDIRNIIDEDYRKYLGILFQDASMYPFKIWENIISNDYLTDNQRIESIINDIGLDKKLLTNGKLNDRYLKKLFSDDGIELSGGEQQKLMIARLMYANPHTIILDEPTAQLDSIVEKKLIDLIIDKFTYNSFLFVTHRLSSAIKMDKIVLIKNGCISEMGTHEDLIELEGEYYRLFEIQKNFYSECENV